MLKYVYDLNIFPIVIAALILSNFSLFLKIIDFISGYKIGKLTKRLNCRLESMLQDLKEQRRK